MERLIYISYEDLIVDIKTNLHMFHPYKFDLVVGIPRSGMIPSYLVSAFLNIDCCDLDSFIENRKLQHGVTRNTKGRLSYPHEAKSILLLDDSIYSGNSIEISQKKIPSDLKSRMIKCAVYATGNGRNKVDFYIKEINGKKIFEWGLFHNNIISKTCFDMDGVLCKECTIEQNDDGEKYLNFIQQAEPLFLPTGEVLAIVTNRLEKYRKQTETWLSEHDIKYKQLIMLDLPSKNERQKIDAGTDHKGKIYKELNEATLFIESSFNQSVSITNVSGKPVYCVDHNKFIEPSLGIQLLSNTSGFYRNKYYQLKHKIKILLKR